MHLADWIYLVVSISKLKQYNVGGKENERNLRDKSWNDPSIYDEW